MNRLRTIRDCVALVIAFALFSCAQKTNLTFTSSTQVAAIDANTGGESTGGSGGTTGGNPSAVQVNSSDPNANPSVLDLCSATPPVLLGTDGVPVPAKFVLGFGMTPIDLQTGQATLTLIGAPSGTYGGVVLSFAQTNGGGCTHGVVLTNKIGTFTWDTSVSMRFIGSFTVSSDSTTFPVTVKCLNDLTQVTSASLIPMEMENNDGSI